MTTRPASKLSGTDLAWAVFSAAMLIQMWLVPNELTTPYHLMWVATMLIYGFRLWPPRVFFPALTVLAVLTGLLFLRPFLAGHTSVDELAEVPLMPLIVGLGGWHAWRRSQAQRRVEELAELESSRLDRQREFLRDTSHAIRTPVTIARGHVELLAMRTQDDETAAAAARTWIVDAEPTGLVLADVRRLEEAVDALVENALRFTHDQDAIRLSARPDGPVAVIEVADSGPGIPAQDQLRVFERFFHRHPRGEEPGTGLGLALVAAVATAHLGTAHAGSAPEGGALLTLRLPLHSPAGPSSEQPAPVTSTIAHPDAV